MTGSDKKKKWLEPLLFHLATNLDMMTRQDVQSHCYEPLSSCPLLPLKGYFSATSIWPKIGLWEMLVIIFSVAEFDTTIRIFREYVCGSHCTEVSITSSMTAQEWLQVSQWSVSSSGNAIPTNRDNKMATCTFSHNTFHPRFQVD